MPFRFEDLKVWQKALELSNNADLLAREFPEIETASLATRLKSAADAVVLTIAEGSTGQSAPEFKKYISTALRSAIEVVACLFIARSRHYCSQDQFDELYGEYEMLSKMLIKLRDSM